jgi:hypothetical protein
MSEAAAATLSVIENAGTFDYTITLKDTGTTAIGSFWLAWVPGENFLPDAPTGHGAPAGWTANPFDGGSFGSSIQFAASGTADYVQSGGTLTGFTFNSPDSPAVLEADSTLFPGTPVLTSVAFEQGILSANSVQFVVACFAAGTRIMTARGEVPVEMLAVGDLVPTLIRGRLAPVRWLGHRAIDCRRHPRPEAVCPVRVRAGAFGPARPVRDLLLSPDHAAWLDGVLIPIRHLVNGATIVRETVDRVEYWHVELSAHDVLLAEGLPVESYLDTGNRGAFANGGPTPLAHPDFSLAVWATNACAPLVVDGPALAAARGRLLDRATVLGHAETADPALHICADGAILRPHIDGPVHRFTLPPGAREVRLMSRVAVPAHRTAGSDDHRRLGVAVARLLVDGMPVEPPVADGWYPAEANWRWTDGAAALPFPSAGRIEVVLLPLARYWDDATPLTLTLATGDAP